MSVGWMCAPFLAIWYSMDPKMAANAGRPFLTGSQNKPISTIISANIYSIQMMPFQRQYTLPEIKI